MKEIWDRISVLNGWRDAPHCWWRYLLLPVQGPEVCKPLGWTSLSIFGFAFFWKHKLSPENQRIANENGQKIMRWVRKHGRRND